MGIRAIAWFLQYKMEMQILWNGSDGTKRTCFFDEMAAARAEREES